MSPCPRAFVVDDEFAVRHSLELLLSALGATTQSYDRAEAFLAECQPNWTGVLFLDLRMPGMSGRELLVEMRDHPGDLSVILMTGHADSESLVWAANEPDLIILEKPFSVIDLKSVLFDRYANLFSGAA